MKTYTIISYNFEVPEDISIGSSYSTLEKAFEIALADVVQVKGKGITLHNSPDSIQGEFKKVDSRLTNNNSLGSSYGISYNSYWGNYPCSRIIIEREIKEV